MSLETVRSVSESHSLTEKYYHVLCIFSIKHPFAAQAIPLVLARELLAAGAALTCHVTTVQRVQKSSHYLPPKS